MMPTLALILAASAVGATIEHQPLRCVVAGSYPWIEARADDVAALMVRFRRADSRDWYTVRLTDDGEQWSGALPRPEARLGSFVYYLEATDTAARSSRTAEATVRVAVSEAACGSEGVGPSVPEASVVAEAPKGKPSLPKGFGEVKQDDGQAKGMFDLSPRTALVAALLVGGGAVAVAKAVADKPLETVEKIEVLGSSPPPGSTLSVRSLALAVRVRVTTKADVAAGSVIVDLRSPGQPIGCVTLRTTHPGLLAGRPLELTVDQLVFVQCPAPFATDQAEVVVRGPGETDVVSDRFPLPYSFVP